MLQIFEKIVTNFTHFLQNNLSMRVVVFGPQIKPGTGCLHIQSIVRLDFFTIEKNIIEIDTRFNFHPAYEHIAPQGLAMLTGNKLIMGH